MKKLIIAAGCLLLVACHSQKYVYRITFKNGDVEYFELNYKPKAGDKTIDYNNETIIGVEKIEKID